jgi:peptidoglycan-associated lipoprotein
MRLFQAGLGIKKRDDKQKEETLMKEFSSLLMISAVFLVMITFGGCAKKVPPTTQAVEVKEKPVAPPPREEVVAKEQPPVVEEQPIVRESGPSVTLADIYFDFDRSDIRPDARQVLEGNASWLKANGRSRIKIEGHCDERGTTEYNLALGQRRAEATKRFLVALGIDASRLSTISYGEERPTCTDHHEGCWSQNRRSHFMVESR